MIASDPSEAHTADHSMRSAPNASVGASAQRDRSSPTLAAAWLVWGHR